MGKSFKRSRFGDDDYSSKSDRMKSRRDQKKKKQNSRYEESDNQGVEGRMYDRSGYDHREFDLENE